MYMYKNVARTWIGVDGVGLPRLPVADDVIVAVLVVELQRLRLDELVRQLVVAVLRQTRHDTAHRVFTLPARHQGQNNNNMSLSNITLFAKTAVLLK